VALFLPNIPGFVFAYFGIQKLGAIAVSLNVMLKGPEIRFILEDSGAIVLVTTEELLREVPRAELSCVKQVVIAEGEAGKDLDFDALMAKAPSSARALDMRPDDPAAILYTSGTTGFPKGVVLSHANVVANSWSTNRIMSMTPEDRSILYLPLFHCFGRTPS